MLFGHCFSIVWTYIWCYICDGLNGIRKVGHPNLMYWMHDTYETDPFQIVFDRWEHCFTRIVTFDFWVCCVWECCGCNWGSHGTICVFVSFDLSGSQFLCFVFCDTMSTMTTKSGTPNAANYPRRPRWRRGTIKPRLSDAELDELEDVLYHASAAWHTYVLDRCFDMGIGDSFEELGMDIMELDMDSMTVKQQRQFYELVIAEVKPKKRLRHMWRQGICCSSDAKLVLWMCIVVGNNGCVSIVSIGWWSFGSLSDFAYVTVGGCVNEQLSLSMEPFAWLCCVTNVATW